MEENFEEENLGFTSIKIFGVIIPFLPKLMIRCGGSFLRFKSRANKAGKTFRKELIKQGIDKETARQLTKSYTAGADLFKLMTKFN